MKGIKAWSVVAPELMISQEMGLIKFLVRLERMLFHESRENSEQLRSSKIRLLG